MKEEKTGALNYWDTYLSPYNIQRLGLSAEDRDKKAVWCQAFLEGGNTLRLWNMAVELKLALLSACSLREGQNVVLVSQYGEESGFAGVIKSIIGEKGKLSLEEIAPRVLTAFRDFHLSPDNRLSWDFGYFDPMPDESVDRIILFNSASYADNWEHMVSQAGRVLREGGRVIVAEAPQAGKELFAAISPDTHFRGLLDLILSGMGISKEDIAQTGPEELTEVFRPTLDWSRYCSWRGVYLFYGQKGNGKNPSFEFPLSNEAVQDFLAERKNNSPWDFLTKTDIDVLGTEIADVEMQKKWGRVFSFGGGLTLHYVNSPYVPYLMYSHLKAEPGYKTMVIGERLEGLGFLPELRRRIGENTEIAAFDIAPRHRETYRRLYESGPDTDIPERHQWDYPFADDYPDNYFDLVWLPQGVHHADNWNNIAPRLVRTLKPGGQLIMNECRLGYPEYHNAMRNSGRLYCIADKGRWAEHVTFEELPDYTTAELAAAFGDSLTDVFRLEADGWLLFWGYKK